MIDSVGNVRSVLLLGGTSEIGLAVLARLTGPRLARVALAGRPSATLDRAGELIRNSGVANVEVHAFDANDRAAHEGLIDSMFSAGDIDVAILAVGAVASSAAGAGTEDAPALDAAAILRGIDTNLTGVASCATQIAMRMRAQGHGTIVMFTAAALGRSAGRPDGAHVGFEAGQAGLDSFALGLAASMHGSGVRVLLVRLGRVPTKLGMELDAEPSPKPSPQSSAEASAGSRRGMPKSKAAARPVAQVADVANSVAAAIRSKRAAVIYVPPSARSAALRARLFSRGR